MSKGAHALYTMVEDQLTVYDFMEPFGGVLDPENRWVRLAHALDWRDMEKKYAKNFGRAGAKALPLRMVFGSLVIREALGLSDRQTVLLITENPYLQYFLGFPSFSNKAPFAAHSMTNFRHRIPIERVQEAVRMLNQFTKRPD